MTTIVERVGEMLKQLSPLDQRIEALVNQADVERKSGAVVRPGHLAHGAG